MDNLEKIIYDLRSYNFTKRKIEANILLAKYLEDLNEIGITSNIFMSAFKSRAVNKLTEKLFEDLESI